MNGHQSGRCVGDVWRAYGNYELYHSAEQESHQAGEMLIKT